MRHKSYDPAILYFVKLDSESQIRDPASDIRHISLSAILVKLSLTDSFPHPETEDPDPGPKGSLIGHKFYRRQRKAFKSPALIKKNGRQRGKFTASFSHVSVTLFRTKWRTILSSPSSLTTRHCNSNVAAVAELRSTGTGRALAPKTNRNLRS